MIIDAFEFARNAEVVQGTLPLRQMDRLDLLDRTGQLDFQLRGYIGDQQRLFLELSVASVLTLRCERCLQPMSWPLELSSRLWLAPSEDAAQSLPLEEERYDAVVGSDAFDVDALIEDEILLALPTGPKHAACPAPLAAAQDRAASPFAALAGLKRSNPDENA